MMKRNKKEFLQSILIVLLSLMVFVLIIAGYIKIDEYKRSFYRLNTKFDTSDIITVSNKLPLSSEVGRNYTGSGMEKDIEGYAVFSINNPNEKKVNYEIYITKKENQVNSIKSNYISLYLTDWDNNPYDGFDKNETVAYSDLYTLTDKPGSRLLYKGSLVSGGTKNFILRSWVSDNYVISDEEAMFSYDIDVRIK